MKDATLAFSMNHVSAEYPALAGRGLDQKLAAVKGLSGESQKTELKKAAQEFEALFIAQLLKVMRETIEESGLLEKGFGKSIYTELFDQEVSLSLARRGVLGISDMLYQSLSGRMSEGANLKPAERPTVGDPACGEAMSRNTLSSNDAGAATGDDIPDMQLPVSAPISSSYGMRNDPFLQRPRFHKGVDLAAPEGMKVVPAMQGRVIYAGYRNDYGNVVVLQHDSGLQTRYGHLKSIHVRVGDVIDSQDTLGTVGSTGRSTGPHLHFEVIRDGIAVDPLSATRPVVSAQHPVEFPAGV